MSLHPTYRVTGAAVLSAVFAMVCGCASAPEVALRPTYVELYESGRWAEAQTAASARAKELSRGPEREQAMLISGQSAHALGRDSEAEPWLKPLIESGNPTIAGRAGVTLGLIAQRASLDSKAVTYFSTAAEKLAGDDSARALLYLGDSYERLKERTKARDAWAEALARAKADPTLRADIGARLSKRDATPTPKRGGLALQLGAFSSHQRAQGMADRLRIRTAALGMAEPRVIETNSKGKQVFVVQVGRFGTKPDAERAKKTLGELAFVTDSAD